MEEPNERTNLINKKWKSSSLEIGSNSYKKEKKGPQIAAAMIACIGSLSMGWTTGYSSPALPQLKDIFHLNTSEVSWFGSLVMLGGCGGALLAGLFMEMYGRKFVLLMANLPLVVGYGIIAGVNSMTWLYVGRTLTGLGIGMMTVTVSVYIAEVTNAKLRGSIGSAPNFLDSFGVFVVFVLGIPLNYKWLAIIGAIIATLMSFLMLIPPETPRWSIKNGQNLKAIKALNWLNGKEADMYSEFQKIKHGISNHPQKFQLSDLILPRYLKPLLLCIALNIFQRSIGHNAVQTYMVSLFQDAGITDANVPPVLASIMAIVGTIPAFLLVDRLGRRPLLITSGIITCVSCTVLGAFYYLLEQKGVTNIGWLSVMCLLVFFFGYSLGWGAVVWIIVGEVLPLRIRAIGAALASITNWLVGFLVSKEFLEVIDATSHAVGFWIFAVICLLSVLFVVFLVPETRGMTLEEIEDYFMPSGNKDKLTEGLSDQSGADKTDSSNFHKIFIR